MQVINALNLQQKNWIEINDAECPTHNTNSQISSKTTILMSSLCNYSDNKQLIFKNCVPIFTNCISEMNNTKVSNAKDLDVVMLVYNLSEYNYNYSKNTSFTSFQNQL